MTDFEASRTALARVVKRVFPAAKPAQLWRGIEGWRVARPSAAIDYASVGTYDPTATVIGIAPRKTGLTVYFLDPGDYYVLDTHAKTLAEDGLTTGRGCIYWLRKGVLPTSALLKLFRAVKERDAAKKPKAGKAPRTKAAAKRRAQTAAKGATAKKSARKKPAARRAKAK